MRVMLAPDSFKGSLTAAEAADAMAAGIARITSGGGPAIEVDRCPVSDGGEGFLDTVLAATGGERVVARVTGPLGDTVDAAWGLIHDQTTAVIEMAQAAGLDLVPMAQRDPTLTTTYGVGELLAEAWARGVESTLVGIGGSATNDGGTGMAQALGYVFLDRAGRPIGDPMCGGQLQDIATIQTTHAHPGCTQQTVLVACDVNNPLTGPNGAAAVYGPQKGATPEQVPSLDAGLGNLSRRMAEAFGRSFDFPGAGAAGGMGAGLRGFCRRSALTPGINLVLEFIDFDSRVEACDLCLTGEGKLDGQSLAGKAVMQVARGAGYVDVPTIALVGGTGDGAENTLENGLNAYHAIGEGHDLAYAMNHAAELLAQYTERVVREWIANAVR